METGTSIHSAESGTFDVAVLCSANRFRSPLVAALLRSRTSTAPVRVASAATKQRSASAALPEAVELGHVYGVDLAGHRARPLPPGSLARADLVLGFERAHVAAAVADGGAPPERTFTLPEIVDLLGAVDGAALAGLTTPARARRAVALAHELRRTDPELAAGAPELADPIGHPHVVFVELAATADRLVRRLSGHLFGA